MIKILTVWEWSKEKAGTCSAYISQLPHITYTMGRLRTRDAISLPWLVGCTKGGVAATHFLHCTENNVACENLRGVLLKMNVNSPSNDDVRTYLHEMQSYSLFVYFFENLTHTHARDTSKHIRPIDYTHHRAFTTYNTYTKHIQLLYMNTCSLME